MFQNIGLPGAIIADFANTLAGQPTNMTEHILSQDAAAAFLGNAFRDIATAGTGRLPQLAQLVAGWAFVRGTQRMICEPADDADRLGYAATTLVFILSVRGNASLALPRGGGGMSWSSSGVAAMQGVTSATMVRVPTQQLAGSLAGVNAAGGMVVLLAQENGGNTGENYKGVWNEEIQLRQATNEDNAEQLVSQYLGIPKNGTKYRASNVNYRYQTIPDFVSREDPVKIVAEVKWKESHIQRAGQIQAQLDLAHEWQVPYYIFVRKGTEVPASLVRLVEETGGRVIVFFE